MVPITSINEVVNEVGLDEPSFVGNDDSQPLLAERDRDATHLGMGGLGDEVVGGGEGFGDGVGGGVGIEGAEVGEGGLEDEEGGADENANEDEEEALLLEKVVDGSRWRI
ncbi:hypothetical protein EV1_028041 [Malus domestica]